MSILSINKPQEEKLRDEQLRPIGSFGGNKKTNRRLNEEREKKVD